jgi:hypothetical protein
VFHHAFCGSTLITRCLDTFSGCFALREPLVLHRLSGDEEPVEAAVHRRALLNITMKLLSRTFEPGQVAILKPSDYVSARIVDLLSLEATSKGLFLYTPLEDFVAQITKIEDRRRWVKRRMHPNSRRFLQSIDSPFTSPSDGEAAAMLWFTQLHNYVFSCRSPEGAKLRELNFCVFLSEPARIIKMLTNWFGIPLSEGEPIETGQVKPIAEKVDNCLGCPTQASW